VPAGEGVGSTRPPDPPLACLRAQIFASALGIFAIIVSIIMSTNAHFS